jgi:hypothetical protein
VQGYQGEYYWFPYGRQGTPYGGVVGGDGIKHAIYSQSSAASADIANGLTTGTNPPPPAQPSPFDPNQGPGQWTQIVPDYWVWLTPSSASSLVASNLGTTSNVGTVVLVGLGLLVVGGIAYFVFAE